jgi:hypothetical protein
MRGESGGRHDPRRRQLDFGESRWSRFVEPVDAKELTVPVESARNLFGRQSLAFTAPAEMFEPRLRHGTLPRRSARTENNR